MGNTERRERPITSTATTRRRYPRRGVACAVALLALGRVAVAAEPADLVLRHGVIHTVDARRPRAEAVAIRGNHIVAVGSSADLGRFVGPATRVVDLAGRTVVPGFDDSHAHLLGIGFKKLDLDLTDCGTFDEVVARVAKVVAASKPGAWIRGEGWHEGKWSAPPAGAMRGMPVHDALSQAAPDNPVALERADGHATLVNARAMAERRVTADTKAPEGGEIVRDAAGRPTGVFVDNAQSLVMAPGRTGDEVRRAIELAQDECLAKGVTNLTDAGLDPGELALLRDAAVGGRLRVRLYVMAGGLRTMQALGKPQIGLGGGMLTVRAVKMYADGALGSRGAALLAPYRDDPGNRGLLVTPPGTLLEAARFALTHGFQMATHAIGDRANRMVLDTYAQALGEHPEVKDPRFRIEHAQVLDPADIPRFAPLHVIAAMQATHCPSDRPWAPRRLGDARVAAGAYVWRKLLDTGARITNGTDAPVEDVSPIGTFHASVTRQDASGQPPGGFDPGQGMTRAEALRTMTLDAAFGRFAEKTGGSIEVGKLADLTVLSQDLMTVPDDALMRTEIVATIVDGRIRFARPGAGFPEPEATGRESPPSRAGRP